MELHRKKQIIENDGERQEVTKAQNVTNALFVGSTAELLKLVKKETKDIKGKSHAKTIHATSGRTLII